MKDLAHRFVASTEVGFEHCCAMPGCGALTHDEEHSQAMLDGISQCATTPQELDLTADAATGALRRALHVYFRAKSRPRKAQAWAYVSCELWNARQDALRSGALKRHTDAYTHISDCYSESMRLTSWARTLEGQGVADVRV